MFDAHCHLDDSRFDIDRVSVLKRAWTSGVKYLIVAGVEPEKFSLQSELAKNESSLFVTYGLHPWIVAKHPLDEVKQLLKKVEDSLNSQDLVRPVGIGECGLDRSRKVPIDSMEKQISAFRFQLDLARQYHLPIVIHVVKAHNELLSLLKRDGIPRRGGMIHAFSANFTLANEYTKLGLHLSFGGSVTNERAKKLRKAVQGIDDKWLLCETDAPDMTPNPPRTGRNEPSYLQDIIEVIADLRGQTTKEIAILTTQNAKQLFDIMG